MSMPQRRLEPLDDGWFGNKYPRDSDHAGLGDWEPNRKKLPHGIGHLVKEAEANGIKFGIWLEPEMVNPKSELYEKHPEWVLQSPNRARLRVSSQRCPCRWLYLLLQRRTRCLRVL